MQLKTAGELTRNLIGIPTKRRGGKENKKSLNRLKAHASVRTLWWPITATNVLGEPNGEALSL